MKRNMLVVLTISLVILLSGLVGGPAGEAASPSVMRSGMDLVSEATRSGLPDATCPPDGQCFADVPPSSPFYLFTNRLYQQDVVSGYACGGPNEPCDPYNRPYYRPANDVTRQQMSKFLDNARRLPEIHMDVRNGTAPIYSRNDTYYDANDARATRLRRIGRKPGRAGQQRR